MVQERPRQFGGVSRFAGPSQSRFVRPQPYASSATASAAATPAQNRAQTFGIGLGKGSGGLGRGKGKGLKRHMRLARRGGVKRIAATIYDDVRQALKDRLRSILKDAVAVVESTGRQTISVRDIIFVLNRQGRPVYGFDPAFYGTR
ncbi:hypothetical protein ACEQ8H_003958 [Pleosporales sp. CAS-2024a]